MTEAAGAAPPAAPHADLRNPDYIAWKDFLARAASWTAGEIETHQLQELRRVVDDAVRHAPAWNELYANAGVGAHTLRSLDDVSRLPMVDKSIIGASLEAFSIPMAGRQRTSTGGSTGIPFELYRDPAAFARELASKAHQYARVGWREGDRQFVLRGIPLASPSHLEFVADFNELRASSYHLVPEVMEQFRIAAFEYGPRWLRCYPSAGDLFARYLEENGLAFPPLRGILCASENLYESQKERLARVFQARVFSHYGHYELAALAGFCEYRDTYHVLPPYGLVELLAPDGSAVVESGRMGEIVATSFINRGTPLIRYRTGDYAVLDGQGCAACGRPYQVWSRVEGRLQEFILTSTGRLISMTSLNAHDDTFDLVRQFQFEQEAAGDVTLRYVPRTDEPSDVVEAHIARRLDPKLGSDIRLRIERVGQIPLTGRGKHRFLIQHLAIVPGDR